MKHTPGPWQAGEIERGESVEIRKDGALLAMVYGSYDFPCAEEPEEFADEYAANAHLIVASPDLLDACKAFVAAEDEWRAQKAGVGEDTFDDPLSDAYQHAQSAIQKAEGNAS